MKTQNAALLRLMKEVSLGTVGELAVGLKQAGEQCGSHAECGGTSAVCGGPNCNSDGNWDCICQERRVQERAVGGDGCTPMEARKTCKGKPQELSKFSRRLANVERDTPVYSKSAKTGWDWCKLQCEYYGLNGCCAYDEGADSWNGVMNNASPGMEGVFGRCYFVRDGSTETDNTERSRVTKFGPNPEYKITPLRYGGTCNWSGSMKMVDYDRKTGCDWDGVDSEGRLSLGGGDHKEAECKKFCMDKADCIVAALSSSGYCHAYKTCNWYKSTGDNGFKMWQKVNSAAPIQYSMKKNFGDAF